MKDEDRKQVQALIENRSIPEPNSGCWLWEGACDRDGYGCIKWKGISRRAHRLSYEAFHGRAPELLSVMHSCDTPFCVNPHHLALGTTGQNLGEASARGRMRGPGVVVRRDHRGISKNARSAIGKVRVTAEDVRRLLDYDPLTGVFIWRDRPDDIGWTRKNGGKEAGSIDASTGYRRIRLLGHDYWAHRLVWVHVYGRWPYAKHEIDHRFGNKLDNRLSELREATHGQNGQNTSLRRNNRSGIKGVSWSNARQKWFASITISGKMVGLGRFDTIEEAAQARRDAEALHHGVFAQQGTA